MKFKDWIILHESKKKSKPVSMKKEKNNKIEIEIPKQRIQTGRKNTIFDDRPKRQKTRNDVNRKFLNDD
jgi:hypothetical protein